MKQYTRYISICALGFAMLASLSAAICADTTLNISPSQKDQLKSLASNTRDRTARERESLRQARSDLMKIYADYALDEPKSKDAREKIKSAQLSLLNIHLDNEIALRNILKEDQFKALREMMKKRMRDHDVMMLVPPQADVLDRLPDKQMLDSFALPDDKRKLLDTQAEKEGVVSNLRDSSKALLDLYSNYSLDSAAAHKLIEKVHRNQVALIRHQHHRQSLLRKALTQDQFDKLQQEISKRMAEHKPRGEHGPHPH